MKMKNIMIQIEELFLDDNMSIAEIAQIMNMDEKSVYAVLKYSLA